MSDLKVFNIVSGRVSELEGTTVNLERELQTLFERNLEDFVGIKFLATEYSTSHGGRMDTLGLDENGFPVIIEYKRRSDENVINQGLFYLDWLMDHKAAFELLVRDTLGQEAAANIDWSAPRLLCVAGNFTKFDEHAVKQMGRNIELIRYKKFGDSVIALELLTAASAQPQSGQKANASGVSNPASQTYKTNLEHLEGSSDNLKELYQHVSDFLESLGDDVQRRELQFYTAFKRIKNFACVEVRPQRNVVRAYVKVDPDKVDLAQSFLRDVRNIGHFGTGDLEITISDAETLEGAKPYLQTSYENS
ncbi:MAG: DUF5655 domain-containing protein [Pseudomonadota bacterium]